MYGSYGENKALKRGSCFIQPVSSFARDPRPKKNIYSKSSQDEISEFLIQRRDLSNGDCAHNFWSDETVQEVIEPKITLSVVKDKKKFKAGHFAKMKKKEDYKKFIESKSKSLEAEQLHLTISMLQSKIDELSKAVEAKSLKKPVQSKQPKETIRGGLALKEKFDWANEEVLKGSGVAGIIIAFLLLGLYFAEGDKFSHSIFSSKSAMSSMSDSSFRWFGFE